MAQKVFVVIAEPRGILVGVYTSTDRANQGWRDYMDMVRGSPEESVEKRTEEAWVDETVPEFARKRKT